MKIIEKGHYYKAYRGKFRKKYFTYEAKKLVKNYWRFHFRYLVDYHEDRVAVPIEENGLCQCITLGRLFNRIEIRFFLFVSTFFDLLIERHFRDSYSEFREYYNFPEIWFHVGLGKGVGPDWFLNYDQFDYNKYKKHNWNDNWNEKHEFYGFIIKDIFDIIDRLGGWLTSGVGQTYGKGYPLGVLNRWMSKI